MLRRVNVWWLDLILGVLLIALGIYTFTNPGGALTGVVVIYGLFAIVTGIVDIVLYVKLERRTGFGPSLSLVSGILSVVAGLLALFFPGAGRFVLSIFLTMWFIAHCVARLANLGPTRMAAGNAVYYVSLVIHILGVLLGIMLIFNPWATAVSVGYIIAVYLVLLGIGSVVTAVCKVRGRG